MPRRVVATICEVYRGVSSNPTRVPGFYFRAKSRNGRVIADSERYSTRSNARRGARRAFPDAEIVNL